MSERESLQLRREVAVADYRECEEFWGIRLIPLQIAGRRYERLCRAIADDEKALDAVEGGPS